MADNTPAVSKDIVFMTFPFIILCITIRVALIPGPDETDGMRKNGDLTALQFATVLYYGQHAT